MLARAAMTASCALLAVAIGSAAHAQEASERSFPITPESMSEFNASFYRGVEICQDAVRADDKFRPEAYADEGWAVRSTGPATNAEGNPYQAVILGHYPDIQLDVRHYGDRTTCSAMSLVLNIAHAGLVQDAVEASWDATLHDEGELKAAVVAAADQSWGDDIQVTSYDVFYNDEFLFEATQMVALGSPAIHLDVTLLENAVANPLSDEEREVVRAEASSRPIQPPPPINISAIPAERDQAGASRISPPEPEFPVVRTVSIPPPAPPPSRSLEDELGEAATNEQLIAAVRMCMDVVSPQMETDTQRLIDDRWGYTQPQRSQNAAGIPFETVTYHKDNLSLVLQDFGAMVQCRAGGRIDDLAQVAELRTALATSLGATDTRNVERLAPWVANIERAAPQTNFDNLFVSGDYSLEIFSQSITGADVGIEEVPQIHMVMVSAVPFPPQYHSREAN